MQEHSSKENLWASVAAIAVPVAVGIATRVLFLSGFQGHDDRNYVFYAWQFAQTGRPGTQHVTAWLGRIGAWLPLVLPLKLFPAHPIAHVSYSLLCSAVGIGLAAWLALRVTGSVRWAMAAGFFMATYPLNILFGTTMYTDVPHGLWVAIALILFWESCRGRTTRNAAVLGLAAGLAAGVAWLHKETAVLIFPALLVIWIGLRRPLQPALFGLLGGLAVVALECGFWYHYTGDFLYRFATIAAEREGDIFSPAQYRSLATIWLSHGKRPVPRIVEPFVMAITQQEFGLHFVLGVVAAVGVAFKHPEKPVRLLAGAAVTFIASVAYLPAFWPVPLGCNPRYYTGASVLIAAAFPLWLAAARPRWQPLAWLSLLSAATVCVLVDGSRVNLDNERLLLAYLRADGVREQRVWVHPGTLWRLWYLNGLVVPDNVGVHLLTATDRAHSYRTARAAWPKLPVWSSGQGPPPGITVVAGTDRVQRLLERFPGLTVERVFQASRSRPVEYLRRVIAKLPMIGQYADRLRPSGGLALAAIRGTNGQMGAQVNSRGFVERAPKASKHGMRHRR